MTWADVEARLAALPRRTLAGFAARAARRALPAVARLRDRYGPEAVEWLNAVDAVVRVVEAFADGRAVSRFTLDLAAEVARGTANATANAARVAGPSPLIEGAEMAYAAAAFAADAARAGNDAKAVACAVRGATAAADGGDVPPEQLKDLAALEAGEPFGPLWPGGEPAGWREAWHLLENERDRLPGLFAV